LTVQGLILTHAHADHIYGLPAFVQHIWVACKEQGVEPRPISVFANAETWAVAEAALEIFDVNTSFLVCRPIPAQADYLVSETANLSIRTTPTLHSIASVAVKVTSNLSGRSVVYSSDTAYCRAVADLATRADALIHEATLLEPEPDLGHSTLADAARIAALADVKQLVLVHYHPEYLAREEAARAEASKYFSGEIYFAHDGDEIVL